MCGHLGRKRKGTWPETLKRGENRKGERGKRTEKRWTVRNQEKGIREELRSEKGSPRRRGTLGRALWEFVENSQDKRLKRWFRG